MDWILFFMLAYPIQGAIPKPTVEIIKGSTTLDTGSVLQLNCSIDTDVRDVTFEWLRDGRIILGSFQSLNITNITKDHAGIYFCTAEDSTGFKQRSSNQYNIIVNYLENATLVITPSNNVNEGDSVTFHCSVNSNLNSLVYTMKRNKSIFIKSALPVHNITHILKIYSGLWICNVLSRTTSLPPVTSESILMTVTELFQIPIFHVSSNSLNSGESLVLTCNVTTSLSPGIIKYRFRSLLFSSPFQSSDTYNKTVRTTDKSLYWCEAKHNFVKWSQGMFIEVKWKVNIVITPTIEGDNMNITCNVEGEEIAGHFSWKRNGFLINGQTSSMIIVANVNRTMVGTSYSCIAGSDPTRSNEAAAIVSFRDFYYKPDPPSLQIFSTSPTSIKVVIIPPTDTGNKPIIHYTMHLQAGNESYTYTNITSLIYNIWNLEPAMTYQLRVKAGNIIGEGEFSEFVSVVTGESPPSAPLQFSHTILHPQEIELLWLKPDPSNGVITNYRICYVQDTNDGVKVKNSVTNCTEIGNVTAFTLTGLGFYNGYNVSVSARNSAGYGFLAIQNQLVTREGAATAPLKFGHDTIFHPQEIRLSWLKPDPSNGVITNYRLCYVQDTNDGVKVKNSVTNCTDIGNGNAFTLTGLGFYNGYNVSVSARNSAGYGSVAILNQLVTQEGAPTPVQDISLISGETLIKVLWKKPKHIYGKLQGYTVTFRLSSGNASSGLMKCIKVTELTCLIDNLLPNKEYVVIVTAMNSLFSTNSTRRTRTRSAVQTNYKNIFVIPGNSVTLKWSIASDYSIEILGCTKGVRKIADGKKGLIAVHNNLNDNRYTASADGKTYQVSIQDLTASDSGVYKCRFILKKNNVVREIMDKIQVTVDDFVDGYQVLGSQTLLIGMTIYELTANISGVMIKIEDINKSLLLHTFIIEFKNYLEVIFLSVFYANVSVKIIQPLKTTKVNFTLSYQSSLLISGDEIKAAFRTSVGKYNNEISFPQNIFYAKIQADSATFEETNICSQRELKKCSENADCKNIPKWYSHACKCKEGFKGNGSTCSKKTPAQGLSKGVIIGSTAGGLAFMILIVAICYVVCKRSKKIKEKRQEKETVENEPYYSDINDTPVIADQEYVEMKSNYTEVKPTLESCYTTLSRT